MLRTTLCTALTVLVTFLAGCERPPPESAGFADAIAAMERRVGGRIGVYAVDTGSGRELAYRAEERFAMASTFKPLLVARVLAEVDAGTLSLDREIGLDGVEIQPYSPATGEVPAGGTLSLERLCEVTVTLGDNTSTNVLLDLIGGPPAFTRFLRDIGDDVTRLDRYEVDLNANTEGDERDTTTPRAMAASLLRVLGPDVLSDDARRRLEDWFVASETGKRRLRAGLPDSWRIGDKTGTGGHGAVNNVAVGWPPGAAPIAMAVYMSRSGEDTATLSDLHAEIARLVAETLP